MLLLFLTQHFIDKIIFAYKNTTIFSNKQVDSTFFLQKILDWDFYDL